MNNQPSEKRSETIEEFKVKMLLSPIPSQYLPLLGSIIDAAYAFGRRDASFEHAGIVKEIYGAASTGHHHE